MSLSHYLCSHLQSSYFNPDSFEYPFFVFLHKVFNTRTYNVHFNVPAIITREFHENFEYLQSTLVICSAHRLISSFHPWLSVVKLYTADTSPTHIRSLNMQYFWSTFPNTSGRSFKSSCGILSFITRVNTVRISTTVVPATSGHLRYGAKVAPCGRWPLVAGNGNSWHRVKNIHTYIGPTAHN